MDLNRDELSMSLWRGKIELPDIVFKKDLCQKLNLPMELVYGRIGFFKIELPWASLDSKPVTVEIRDVVILVSKYFSTFWVIECIKVAFTSWQSAANWLAQESFVALLFVEFA